MSILNPNHIRRQCERRSCSGRFDGNGELQSRRGATASCGVCGQRSISGEGMIDDREWVALTERDPQSPSTPWKEQSRARGSTLLEGPRARERTV